MIYIHPNEDKAILRLFPRLHAGRAVDLLGTHLNYVSRRTQKACLL